MSDQIKKFEIERNSKKETVTEDKLFERYGLKFSGAFGSMLRRAKVGDRLFSYDTMCYFTRVE